MANQSKIISTIFSLRNKIRLATKKLFKHKETRITSDESLKVPKLRRVRPIENLRDLTATSGEWRHMLTSEIDEIIETVEDQAFELSTAIEQYNNILQSSTDEQTRSIRSSESVNTTGTTIRYNKHQRFNSGDETLVGSETPEQQTFHDLFSPSEIDASEQIYYTQEQPQLAVSSDVALLEELAALSSASDPTLSPLQVPWITAPNMLVLDDDISEFELPPPVIPVPDTLLVSWFATEVVKEEPSDLDAASLAPLNNDDFVSNPSDEDDGWLEVRSVDAGKIPICEPADLRATWTEQETKDLPTLETSGQDEVSSETVEKEIPVSKSSNIEPSSTSADNNNSTVGNETQDSVYDAGVGACSSASDSQYSFRASSSISCSDEENQKRVQEALKAQHESESQQQTEQIQILLKKLKALDDRNEEIENHVVKVQNDHRDMARVNEDYRVKANGLESELVELTRKLALAEKERDSLAADKKRFTTESDHHASILTVMKESNAFLRRRLKNYLESVADELHTEDWLSQALADQMTEVLDNNDFETAHFEELTKEKNQIQLEKDGLTTQVTALETKVQNLEDEVKVITKEKVALEGRELNVEMANNAERVALKALEASEAEVKKLKEEKEDLGYDYRDLQIRGLQLATGLCPIDVQNTLLQMEDQLSYANGAAQELQYEKLAWADKEESYEKQIRDLNFDLNVLKRAGERARMADERVKKIEKEFAEYKEEQQTKDVRSLSFSNYLESELNKKRKYVSELEFKNDLLKNKLRMWEPKCELVQEQKADDQSLFNLGGPPFAGKLKTKQANVATEPKQAQPCNFVKIDDEWLKGLKDVPKLNPGLPKYADVEVAKPRAGFGATIRRPGAPIAMALEEAVIDEEVELIKFQEKLDSVKDGLTETGGDLKNQDLPQIEPSAHNAFAKVDLYDATPRLSPKLAAEPAKMEDASQPSGKETVVKYVDYDAGWGDSCYHKSWY